MSKPEGAQKPDSKPAASAKGGKDNGPVGAGHCCAVGCKASSSRFSFCDEHYDHFKFGLLKKDGQLVPDYEKKLGHYLAHKGKGKTHKVA